MNRYQRELTRLYELQKFGIKLGLNSTRNLLKRLGDPHKKWPALHLAGSNGKGSVATMVEATLLAAGIKVGLYTSPHLVRFTERFRIGGREISQKRVIELARAVWEVCDMSQPPTFFEHVTAMSFLLFAEEEVDIAIIETGLGGRLDATNICRPMATVITNISLEHTEFLGDTLAEVAYEKAGIIKRKVPLVHGVARGPARRVVEERAAELAAPVLRLGRELKVRRAAGGAFSLSGPAWSLKQAVSSLPGRHQPGNAALALGALEVIAAKKFPVTAEHFRRGLAQARWPGRLERWPDGPGQPALWLDGAHNPGAAKALLTSLDLVRRDGGPLVMVAGIMADKDIAGLLGLLVPAADRLVLTRTAYERGADPEVLAQALPQGSPPHELERDLGRAIERAKKLAGPKGSVLITGSLFTVGEARAYLLGEQVE